MRWQLTEAKRAFDDVFARALSEGPQVVTGQNQEEVVVLARATCERLVGNKPGLLEFLVKGPGLDDVVPSRDRRPLPDEVR